MQRNSFILFGIIFLFFSNISCWAADWRFYNEDDLNIYFYDAASIRHISKNIVEVLTRIERTPEGLDDYIKKFGEEYRDMSHSKVLHEINCAEQKKRVTYITHYNHDGNIIYSEGSMLTRWVDIHPESIGESLLKAACKK